MPATSGSAGAQKADCAGLAPQSVSDVKSEGVDIPHWLNSIPHSHKQREFFYAEATDAVRRALQAGEQRLVVQCTIPELNAQVVPLGPARVHWQQRACWHTLAGLKRAACSRGRYAAHALCAAAQVTLLAGHGSLSAKIVEYIMADVEAGPHGGRAQAGSAPHAAQVDVFRIGTLLEMAREIAGSLAEDGQRVKVCVQQAMGVGVFQGASGLPCSCLSHPLARGDPAIC